MSTRARFKGRFIKEKVLAKKEKCKAGIARQREETRNLTFDRDRDLPIEGNRIIDLNEMKKNAVCHSCQTNLTLDCITGEINKGLHSVLIFKCEVCASVIHVDTQKRHTVNRASTSFLEDKSHNDVTTNAVLGVYHAGVGGTELNKILACLNLPVLSQKLFRRYEQEVCPIIEERAKSSCDTAAKQERELVLKGLERLKEDLPQEIRDDFFREISSVDINNSKNFDKALGNIINIIVSYDMGWSKKGSGRSYDSLNGYGAIIGFFSKKVLDYRTRNKKCRLCDLGKSPESHDCRRNCNTSSKAMEADVGAELVLKSEILKENGLNVKVVVGDEDSSLMAKINKENPGSKIHKLADGNHVKKNLSKRLYKLKDKHKVLAKKGLITHIKKCFAYALTQNRGNTSALSDAVHSIPDHLFNYHENCGSWCKSKQSLSKQKFTLQNNQDLHNDLISLFGTYADNAYKYSMNSSSQANEALNNSICHKFPKNKSYSTSPSGDTRVATSILTINDGNCFVVDVKKSLGLKTSQSSLAYYKKLDRYKQAKSIESKSIRQKKRRIELTQEREKLRITKESSEGLTYKPNLGFDSQANEVSLNDLTCLSIEESKIVCFDLETSGRYANSDILQIAAVIDEKIFSVYIKPTKSIDTAVTQINGLENIDQELYFRGKKVITVSMLEALKSFHTFLSNFAGKCLLTAHNAPFDIRFLMRELNKYELIKEFSDIVYGFCDTLRIFRRKYPERKGSGMNSLSQLAGDLLTEKVLNQENDVHGFHEATYDVLVLQRLITQRLSNNDIFENTSSFVLEVKNCFQKAKVNVLAKSFSPLQGIITDYMIKKIAATGKSYEDLQDIVRNEGKDSLKAFLIEKQNKQARVTRDKNILLKIVNHFDCRLNDA